MLDKRIFLSDYRTFRQQRGHLSLWNYASENHTEKLEQRWKSWEQKKWVTLKVFSVWFIYFFFQFDYSVFEQ